MAWKKDPEDEGGYTFRFGGIVKTILEFVPGGILRAGKTAYSDDSHTGWWIGIDPTDSLAKINIGSSALHLKWTGSALTIVGDGSALTSINGGNIQTGTVTAAKINVSNLAALSVNTGSLTVSGTITAGTGTKDSTLDGLAMDATEIVAQLDGADLVKLDGDGLTITIPASKLLDNAVKWLLGTATPIVIGAYNALNKYILYLNVDATASNPTQGALTELINTAPTGKEAKIYMQADDSGSYSAVFWLAGDASTSTGALHATAIDLTGAVTVTGDLNTTGVLKIDGTQVVTNRQAAISNVSATGAAEDSVARTAINNILAMLRTHGLIAT